MDGGSIPPISTTGSSSHSVRPSLATKAPDQQVGGLRRSCPEWCQGRGIVIVIVVKALDERRVGAVGASPAVEESDDWIETKSRVDETYVGVARIDESAPAARPASVRAAMKIQPLRRVRM